MKLGVELIKTKEEPIEGSKSNISSNNNSNNNDNNSKNNSNSNINSDNINNNNHNHNNNHNNNNNRNNNDNNKNDRYDYAQNEDLHKEYLNDRQSNHPDPRAHYGLLAPYELKMPGVAAELPKVYSLVQTPSGKYVSAHPDAFFYMRQQPSPPSSPPRSPLKRN